MGTLMESWGSAWIFSRPGACRVQSTENSVSKTLRKYRFASMGFGVRVSSLGHIISSNTRCR